MVKPKARKLIGQIEEALEELDLDETQRISTLLDVLEDEENDADEEDDGDDE